MYVTIQCDDDSKLFCRIEVSVSLKCRMSEISALYQTSPVIIYVEVVKYTSNAFRVTNKSYIMRNIEQEINTVIFFRLNEPRYATLPNIMVSWCCYNSTRHGMKIMQGTLYFFYFLFRPVTKFTKFTTKLMSFFSL